MQQSSQRWLQRPSSWVAILVAIHGAHIIFETLINQLRLVPFPHFGVDVDLTIDVPLLIGLGLLYLSLSLWRRKRTAWMAAMVLYVFLLGLNTHSIASFFRDGGGFSRLVSLLLPLIMMGVLWIAQKEFVVRSDFRTFTSALKVALVVLITAFLYGTAGFMLMERQDFRQDISLAGAMHYTIDQFDLTTNPLHAYTRRAVLFQDSLSFISISAIGLTLVSLFQPIRARYSHAKEHSELAYKLVHEFKHDSEDFFKLWPSDKAYFFGNSEHALIAYKVQRGVALTVGDPLGKPKATTQLIKQFEDLCFVNDWRPAFVHITPAWKKRFETQGYQVQLIGKEAIVDVDDFVADVAHDKYFRQINNRFTKLGFTAELLVPPHHAAVVDRLKVVSDEWLRKPGRVERGFMMGHFSEQYIQQCAVFVARDAAGTIQGFLNVLPSPVPGEADFDMLRSSERALGNINDFLLTRYIEQLHHDGIQRLNMGLCPLTGIEEEPNTLINRTLRFVYSNGDRLYSFNGLYKFKAKYQPEWSDRYIAYRGGTADFTRVMAALNAAMKV